MQSRQLGRSPRVSSSHELGSSVMQNRIGPQLFSSAIVPTDQPRSGCTAGAMGPNMFQYPPCSAVISDSSVSTHQRDAYARNWPGGAGFIADTRVCCCCCCCD